MPLDPIKLKLLNAYNASRDTCHARSLITTSTKNIPNSSEFYLLAQLLKIHVLNSSIKFQMIGYQTWFTFGFAPNSAQANNA